MKDIKKVLRIALLVVIFCKGYVGGLKLWEATLNNPEFKKDSAEDAFFLFNTMTPTEWVCLGSALSITIFSSIVGLIWLATNDR